MLNSEILQHVVDHACIIFVICNLNYYILVFLYFLQYFI